MYRPLPSCVTVSKSTIDGLGLVAAEPIKAGTEIGMSHVRDSRFEHGWIRTPLGGFYNHSSNPNCKTKPSPCGSFLFLVTIREVRKSEELTVEYSLYKPG